jgi:hypothetical protein
VEALVNANLDNAVLGALPGGQCMDIAYTMQVLGEISMDHHSKFGFAQADIKQYYDRICPLPLINAMIGLGIPQDVSCCCLRLHLLPELKLALHW